MKYLYMIITVFIFSACSGLPEDFSECGEKNIMVLGDSITIDWTPLLREKMALEGYHVVHNNKAIDPENPNAPVEPEKAKYVTDAITHLDRWLSQCDSYEAILWSETLWDTSHSKSETPEGPSTDIETYEIYLNKMAEIISLKTDKLIWITPTPVEEGDKGSEYVYLYLDDYLNAGLDMAKTHDTYIIDLYTFGLENIHLKNKGDLHWRGEGSSEALAGFIEQELKGILE